MHVLMCAVHVHHPGDIWLTFSRSEVRSLSHVQLFAASWTVAHQAPLSMGFSRHELLEWDHPDPGIEPKSPALQADALVSELLSLILYQFGVLFI